jgi:hypothetical protein
MTDALLNLLALAVLSMVGGYSLTSQFDWFFWPATAGCFYVLVLSRAFQR